jgi:hypothetical protein
MQIKTDVGKGRNWVQLPDGNVIELKCWDLAGNSHKKQKIRRRNRTNRNICL